MRLIRLNTGASNHQWLRLRSFLPLYINIALYILCSKRLRGQQKMNTESNPGMTELAMMTNVPAGRTGGSTIPHCHQDGLSHMTQHGRLPPLLWKRFYCLLYYYGFRETKHVFLVFISIHSFVQTDTFPAFPICDGVLYANTCF